jgi:hypothetical protein
MAAELNVALNALTGMEAPGGEAERKKFDAIRAAARKVGRQEAIQIMDEAQGKAEDIYERTRSDAAGKKSAALIAHLEDIKYYQQFWPWTTQAERTAGEAALAAAAAAAAAAAPAAPADDEGPDDAAMDNGPAGGRRSRRKSKTTRKMRKSRKAKRSTRRR